LNDNDRKSGEANPEPCNRALAVQEPVIFESRFFNYGHGRFVSSASQLRIG
jgi:hypothetical protein